MTSREQWLDLAKRCAEATEPTLRFSFDLIEAADSNWTKWCGGSLPEVSASLDAIVSLIEKTLPGWAWKVGTCSVSDDAWLVPDFNDPIHGARLLEQFGPITSGSIWDAGIDIDRRPPGNVPLALCQAYCFARAEMEAANV